MAESSGLKLPDEYTEISYEDGELSGSGHRHWDEKDTWTTVKWGVSFIAAGTVLGLGIKFRRQIGNGIGYAWDQITSCCSPNNPPEDIPIVDNYNEKYNDIAQNCIQSYYNNNDLNNEPNNNNNQEEKPNNNNDQEEDSTDCLLMPRDVMQEFLDKVKNLNQSDYKEGRFDDLRHRIDNLQNTFNMDTTEMKKLYPRQYDNNV